MGLFSRLKKGKTNEEKDPSYVARPNFYADENGNPFGAIALTENTETVLPKTPQKRYQVDGKQVTDWKLILVSTTKDTVIGDCDYFQALEKLESYILESHDDTILVRGLTLGELESLMQ